MAYTNITRAIELIGDCVGNPGGKFAEAAAALLRQHYTPEQLDTVEAELAAYAHLEDDDFDEVVNGDDLSDFTTTVVWFGFDLVEVAYDSGLIEGA